MHGGRHHFNPRPLAGATPWKPLPTWKFSNFNPRPLAGATGTHFLDGLGFRHFNPRPLAGATRQPVCFHGCQRISIHAPLRGRLNTTPAVLMGWTISIHAPLRGRHGTARSEPISSNFNPRPLAGATPIVRMVGGEVRISIHAPLRGRPDAIDKISRVERFQSTPPCGGDLPVVFAMSPAAIFQSTPPCGGDQLRGAVTGRSIEISIHAPLRGRLQDRRTGIPAPDFNPRPLAGATAGHCSDHRAASISIHAPLRGRQKNTVRFFIIQDFNPRPLAGATEWL